MIRPVNIVQKMRRPAGVVTFLIVCASLLTADDGRFRLTAHGSSTSGVLRTSSYPRGSCAQCHTTHDPAGTFPYGLFRENSNDLCMTASQGGCHADQPTGATSGYPAQESDRMPIGSGDPGYFEFNSAGVRTPGLANLVRWPGRQVWQNGLYSAHRSDPDMPIKDVYGNGSCDNCHNVHGGPSLHDLLDTTWSGITGSQNGLQASNYYLCLSCHNTNGPIGMTDASRWIADYYDRSVNPSALSGHGITTGGGYVAGGSRLPCFDCHNPHGSQGYGGQGPNDYLLSDQRPGWYSLTDIRNDSVQVRRFCFGCHRSSDGLGGGTVEELTLAALPNSVTAHAYNSTAHCYDCHGRDYSSSTSNNVHNPDPGGDCLSCHAVARNGRRPVVGEFARKAHHAVRQGQSGSVTTNDCGVCHMEGDATTGEINGQYHRDGQIDLRDPDTGAPIPGFPTFTRDLNSPFLEPWVVDVQNQLCLRCHDADGALSLLARVPGGTATRPFSGQDTVVNVYAQFDPANTAYHPVRAAGTNPFTVPSSSNNNARLMLPPFNQTSVHDVISCFDCHEANGHGGTNSGILYTETYFREPTRNANFANAQRTFCGRCHDLNVYTQSDDDSRFRRHTQGAHVSGSGSSGNYMSCRGCHAGIYDNDLMTTCDNRSGLGRIHGYSLTWAACSPTPGTSPRAFLIGGYLKGWLYTSSTSATCYANCHHSSGQRY